MWWFSWLCDFFAKVHVKRIGFPRFRIFFKKDKKMTCLTFQSVRESKVVAKIKNDQKTWFSFCISMSVCLCMKAGFQPIHSVIEICFASKTGKSLNKKDELRSIKNASLNKNCDAISSGWLFISLTWKMGRRKLRRTRKESLFLVVMEGGGLGCDIVAA